MKRLFALALLGLIVFVGCNNDEGAAPADTGAGAGGAAPAPATPAAPAE